MIRVPNEHKVSRTAELSVFLRTSWISRLTRVHVWPVILCTDRQRSGSLLVDLDRNWVGLDAGAVNMELSIGMQR